MRLRQIASILLFAGALSTGCGDSNATDSSACGLFLDSLCTRAESCGVFGDTTECTTTARDSFLDGRQCNVGVTFRSHAGLDACLNKIQQIACIDVVGTFGGGRLPDECASQIVFH